MLKKKNKRTTTRNDKISEIQMFAIDFLVLKFEPKLEQTAISTIHKFSRKQHNVIQNFKKYSKGEVNEQGKEEQTLLGLFEAAIGI